MIENIVDGRRNIYAAKGLDAFVEPIFPEQDNASGTAGDDLPECARLRDTSVNEAVRWALSFGFPVTLYIYEAEVDQGTIIDAAHLFRQSASRHDTRAEAPTRSAAVVGGTPQQGSVEVLVDVYTLSGARLGCYSVGVSNAASLSEIEDAAIDRAIFEGDALRSDRKFLIACVRNRQLGSRSA